MKGHYYDVDVVDFHVNSDSDSSVYVDGDDAARFFGDGEIFVIELIDE